MPPPKLNKKRKSDDKMKTRIKDKKGLAKSCMKGFFSHGGLLLIVCLYAIIGAYILIAIESGEEEKKFNTKKVAAINVQSSRDYIMNYAWYHSSIDHTRDEFIYLIRRNLDLYHRYIVVSAKNSYYDGDGNSWNYDWTFPKSLLFTTTTMGAIGYGHIAPKTDTGKLFTIYYGMIGIPLLLLFLANIGEFLASSFRYIYSRLCCRLCRIRRVVSELKPKKQLKPKVLWKDEIGMEQYMPTELVDVPIVVILCVIFVYLMLGGVLFSYWEGWELHEAVYFTFITLTTIGFGDYVPGNSFGSGPQTIVSSLKMIFTIVFCMLGMALISMSINLMQEQIIGKVKWVAKELGVSKAKKEGPELKYKILTNEPGSVHETPPDKDGSQTRVVEEELKKKMKKNAAKKIPLY